LTGYKKCFQAEVRQVASHINSIHFIIHITTIVSRGFQPQLHIAVQEAAKVVNFVKARCLLDASLLAVFYREVQAENKSFLSHSDVWWLSTDTVPERLDAFKEVVHRFLDDFGYQIYQHLDMK
jgi:hypothetical protein